MKKYIKNKNFLPSNLKDKEEKSMHKKYLILGLIILNLYLAPINIDIFYNENNKEADIPVYQEITEPMYYNEIKGIIEILYKDFKEGNINNNKGQIITDEFEVIYKLEEESKIKIKSIRKEENLGYIVEVNYD